MGIGCGHAPGGKGDEVLGIWLAGEGGGGGGSEVEGPEGVEEASTEAGLEERCVGKHERMAQDLCRLRIARSFKKGSILRGGTPRWRSTSALAWRITPVCPTTKT